MLNTLEYPAAIQIESTVDLYLNYHVNRPKVKEVQLNDKYDLNLIKKITFDSLF